MFFIKSSTDKNSLIMEPKESQKDEYIGCSCKKEKRERKILNWQNCDIAENPC